MKVNLTQMSKLSSEPNIYYTSAEPNYTYTKQKPIVVSQKPKYTANSTKNLIVTGKCFSLNYEFFTY